MNNEKSIDIPLFITTILLVVSGLVIFFSASLGLLARDGAQFGSIVTGQIGLGLILGGACAFIVSRIPYKFWGRQSFWLLLIAIIATLAVFIPGVGFEHGGARRWISVANYFTFQPAEFLKIAYIIYLSAWIASVKTKVTTLSHGFVPFIILSGICAGILLAQPDTDTTILMLAAGFAIYYVAGAHWKHIALLVLICGIAFSALIMTRPYLKSRVMTFINPSADSLGSGYQIQQSLIAIGSGGIAGKGFGQSVQKFNYLPEPIGDSIFAVYAEEFGFIGTTFLLALFVFFVARSIKISFMIKDTFGGLLMLGLAILITAQSFLNMAAMLGIFPLSGLPLIFVSHGGTALFFSLFAIGIMLNISRYKN